MTKLEEIKKHLNGARVLKTIRTRYFELISDSSVDKHGLKFNDDNRFSVFAVKASLDCHYGYYGSSSCYTLDTVDDKMAQSYFVYAINKHMDLILNTMAEAAEQEATKLKQKAQDEISAAQEILDSLQDENL